MYFSYVNHLGEFINFYGDSPYILTEHSFTDWVLSYSTAGNRSSGYRIAAKEIPFKIRIMPRRFKGKDRPLAFSSMINRFVTVVAADKDQPGRLYAKTGEYLEGRIIASEKADWNVDKSVTISCRFRVDDPVWMHQETHHVEFNDETTYEDLDYPYDYVHDYAATLNGYKTIRNASTEEADYILTIHGPASTPFVTLNGIKVGASVILGADDSLVIDSRKKTVTKYAGNIVENAFNSRYKGGPVSMFTKLAPGAVSAIWSGAFDFDLSVVETRREPAWMI